MGLRAGLVRLAAGGEVPVFSVAGLGGRVVVEELGAVPGIEVVDHPRAAALLVVVGRVPPGLLGPVLAVHDQLPSPRASVWWPVGADGGVPGPALAAALPGLVVGRSGDVNGLRRLFADMLDGGHPTDPAALGDIDPAPWRGVGPYGHGGTGMTGGVPYGRPMAGRAPDRDRLELDQLPLRFGPLFPPFPPGLVLELLLQGDVVQQASVGDNRFRTEAGTPVSTTLDTDLFLGALDHPVLVSDLELARARHHLRWLARVLRLHGLSGRAWRTLALARCLTAADAAAVTALTRTVGRSRSMASALRGQGVLEDPGTVTGGPVARAGGEPADARSGDDSYRGLGFEPVTHPAGDAWDRLRQRLGEAAQAMALVERAGDRVRAPGPPVEGPRGLIAAGLRPPSSSLLELLPDLLAGQEWGDAVNIVASLDLDLEEAAQDGSPGLAGATTPGAGFAWRPGMSPDGGPQGSRPGVTRSPVAPTENEP
ncbi:MAG: hypothetical protein ACR2G7_01235 [Acidimicrobiales bacterium]